MTSPYIESVENACRAQCPGLLFELLPEGHIVGRKYLCGTIRGGPGDSMSVDMQEFLWKDFASGEKGGKGLIGLYARVKGIEWKLALAELAKRYGIEAPKRVTSKESDWTLVCPVPADAYECDDLGQPLVPDGVLHGKPDAVWPYLNPEFELLFFVCRFNPGEGRKKKDFYPLSYWRHKDGRCCWRMKELPTVRPLFNLENLTDEQAKILIVEGEKCTCTARRLLPEYWVTCWPGGANAAHYADWTPVRRLIAKGAKVLLWPDKDAAGESAMTSVSKQLACPLEITTPDPRWPTGYDIADLERDGWTAEQLEEYIGSHRLSVPVQATPERVEVQLVGHDPKEHMDAVFAAIAQTKAQIYSTVDGPACLKRNIYGNMEIESLTSETLRSYLVPYIRPKKYHNNTLVDCRIQDDLARDVLFNMNGQIPALESVYHTPVFLKGRLVDKEGYDSEARAWVVPPQGYNPEMPVEEAWELIEDWLPDFPFETDGDRTTALAFVLTALLRPSIHGPTPMFRFEAPTRRTGKTMLFHILAGLCVPNIGMHAPLTSEDEARKLITTELLKSPVITAFDNVEKLDNAVLKMALTVDTWEDRVLGENRKVSIPIRTLWACTTNNPIFSGEVLGRSARIRLNAHTDCPEKRTGFRHADPISYMRNNRAALVSAFVACVRFGLESATDSLPVLGGYEAWIRTVYPVLQANGWNGLLKSFEEDRDLTQDSQQEALCTFIQQWAETYGDAPVFVSQLCELPSATDLDVKRNAAGQISKQSLGAILGHCRGSVVSGFTIQPAKRSKNQKRYTLISGNKVENVGKVGSEEQGEGQAEKEWWDK